MLKSCRFFVIAIFALAASTICLAADRYEAGKHYDILPQPVPSSDPNRIEVVEMFWYGCPHCYHFEPSLKPWVAALPKDVAFVRLPVTWSDDATTHAKIFYTAKQFHKLEQMHDTIFNTMQIEHKKLTDENEIAALFARFGVDEKSFASTFNSFVVDAAVRQAGELTREYKLTGTPMLVVNGKYTISASREVSQEEMLKIASFLIEKERAEKAKPDKKSSGKMK